MKMFRIRNTFFLWRAGRGEAVGGRHAGAEVLCAGDRTAPGLPSVRQAHLQAPNFRMSESWLTSRPKVLPIPLFFISFRVLLGFLVSTFRTPFLKPICQTH